MKNLAILFSFWFTAITWALPSDINEFSGIKGKSPLPDMEITHGTFNLINSLTDEVITTISDGDIFYLDVVGDSLNIQAIPFESYSKVRFTTDDGYSTVERYYPYAYKKDHKGEDYFNWKPELGSLAFTVEYMNGDTVVHTDTFTITFAQTPPTPTAAWIKMGEDIHYTEGNVGIGTTHIGSWKLAVGGKIRAEEIKVETDWADYVFAQGYDLPSLEQVEAHIQEKGHLINIPSAAEVEAHGIELGDMNRLLLEKIEELTLYILKQEKRIKELEERTSLDPNK